MPKGIVKWFSRDRGYGFITPTDGTNNGEDIFSHYTDIQGEGFKTLIEGQNVEFDVVPGKQGIKATNVIVTPIIDTKPVNTPSVEN